MCGIAGLYLRGTRDLAASKCALDRMLARVAHRGPDDVGTWVDGHAGVLLGHRRLAILDTSSLGHQPMLDPDGRLVIVFNGEIYNFPELRKELAGTGVSFTSNSDTEVLLHGYRRWGERVVDHLVGMFAFAIWDRDAGQLFLARDRAGEKPLYYATGPWGFAFASEIGALAELPQVSREIDEDALALYLHLSYVPAPHSIYRDVRKLPPARAMRVRDHVVTTWPYWDPVPFAVGPRLDIDEEEALAELDVLLRQAVRGQMLSDVPLGAFLSGGIDSTAVASLMMELSDTPVRTFNIGFDVPRFDESVHAQAVADYLGTDHTVEFLTANDALALVPKLPAMYGEPFADSSALPTHLVARTARRHVTVSLSGDGGDEAFGGYTRFDYLVTGARLSRALGPARGLVGSALSHVPGKVGRGARLIALPPREMYRGLLTLCSAGEVNALTGRTPVLAQYDRAWAVATDRPLHQRAMLADMLLYLPEDILVKVDRAAMATSLETRAPMLDHRVLEFALRLPPALVRGKRLLKRYVYRRVPRALVDRPKQGFGVPVGSWFRSELRELLLDVLTRERLAAVGLRRPELVQRMIADHMAGTRDQSSRLWTLLVLGLWHEGRDVRPSAPASPELTAVGAASGFAS